MRRLDNIDLRLLRVFVALVEAEGFAKAQITLNLSPSTLSTHLSALERKIGGQLCQRGRGGFRLTPFGEATYAAAVQLFIDLEDFSQRLEHRNGQLVGRLRVGIVDGVVHNPQLGLQRAIDTFTAASSGVFIELHIGTPHELEEAIAEGQRDLVIGPFSQRGPNVSYYPHCTEKQALYCGLGHELFEAADEDIADALEHTRFSVRAYRHLDDLYRVNHPRASASVVQMEAQEMLLLSGRYVGFLPRPIGDHWVARGQMRCIRPDKYEFTSQHFVAVRKSQVASPLVRAFMDELRKSLPKVLDT